MAGKIPPQSLEAEQAIIGSLMLDKDAWLQIADALLPEDFYSPAHQTIYSSMRELSTKSQAIDMITVTAILQNSGAFEGVGGHSYLVELLDRTVSSANLSEYVRIVKEKSLLRKVISVSSEIMQEAYSERVDDVESFLDRSEARFFHLSENRDNEGLSAPMEAVKQSLIKIEDYYKRKADITGLASGFTQLDRMTSGMHAGELIIVAARPSMGKTAFGLNLAQHVALKDGKTVAFFSLEMSKESVFMRLLSSEAKINLRDIRSGRITDSQWPKLISAAGHLSDSKFFIDDSSRLSPFEIRTRARRLKAMTGSLDLIVIDYLQFMSLKQKVDNREREVSEISRGLKSLAKELGIPVIALAQLNRGVEGRTEKRPMLSDLRESGSLEQDADVIMLLYRDDYYDKDDASKAGAAEVIIGKQRNGPTGTVKLRFDAEYGRFRDLEIEPQVPPPPPATTSPNRPTLVRNFAPGANA